MPTNVFWAGKVFGEPVVSIFNNPDSDSFQNTPLLNRYDYIDRIYFDSRFDYLSIRWQTDITVPFSYVARGGSGETTSTLALHNFGYPPASIIIDKDTREIISNNSFIQIVNFSSYRTVSYLIDSNRFYIKEKYLNVRDDLPAITRRYTILAFGNSALTP
jgi:hypothetical protein